MQNEQEQPIEPVTPIEEPLQYQPASMPILTGQEVIQPNINNKGKWYKNKKIVALIAIVIIILLASAGALYVINKDNNPGKLSANNYIANVSSCSKITELLKRTRSNINAEDSTSKISANVVPGAALSIDSATADSSTSSSDHSTTNVQVQGVDEADVVKNDGEYIYTISGGNIYIAKVYPPKEANLQTKIVLADKTDTYSSNNGAKAIFIYKNRLMAIGSKYVKSKDLPVEPQSSSQSGTSSSSASESSLPPDDYVSTVQFTYIKIWDTTEKKAPKLVRSTEFEGNYSASRMIDQNVHVVLNSNPRLYNITSNTNGNDLIPMYSDVLGDNKASYKPTCSCQQVEYFKNSQKEIEDNPNAFINVISLPINNDKQPANRQTVIGNSDTVYASDKNLYLASVTYQKEGRYNYSQNTQLHKFNLKNASSQYQASADIGGQLLNQYSMDENGKYFRIAATKGEITDTDNKSTNHIYVLNSKMEKVGSLDNLAPGEKIYSSRFVGDRVYLVTFKKVDPFFVIDLKDPTKPSVLGYLKIPGYSDYLHPYDENHIIGIGKEAIDASSQDINARNLDFAWYQGLKMAIFDVTDVKSPKEMHKVVIGDRGTDSPVLEDPKAFLFSKSKNLLALPISLYELTPEQKKQSATANYTYGKFSYQGAYIYNIDLSKGFTLKGRITHSSGQPTQTQRGYDYQDYATEVRRVLYIGDYLYTVSDSKINANTLSDLTQTAEIKLN